MKLHPPLRVAVIVAGVLACNACGIKGPLYLPPKNAPDVPAAAPGDTPAARAPTTPEVTPGRSPPTATPPAERKP